MATVDAEALSDLESNAAEAARAGDVAGAARLLETARDAGQASLALQLNLAALYRRLGRVSEALTATDAGLRLNPRDFTALLLRGSLLERLGRGREAATAYGAALTQAPTDREGLAHPMKVALEHAEDVHRQHQTAMVQALATASRDVIAGADPVEAARIQQFMDGCTGRRRRYRQEPAAFFFPGLPAIEFYERSMFPWLSELEGVVDVIGHELAALVDGGARGLTPYVDYDDSLPLDQWRALNRSPDWSAFHLLANGRPVPENAGRCPRTMEALAKVPQPQVPGRSPAAMFSVLRPHTHIPAHTGVSNTRLVCHLPLIVPPNCRFRVGNEVREWVSGHAWIFDDTIEHEAFNDSDQDRIVLIFDVAQPLISAREHAAISVIAKALDAFGGTPITSVL